MMLLGIAVVNFFEMKNLLLECKYMNKTFILYKHFYQKETWGPFLSALNYPRFWDSEKYIEV